MNITIQVNGQKQRVEEGSTVTGLLTGLGIRHEQVAVELNLQVIDKQNYEKTLLRDGDKVEIIRFVGGGGGT
jgi:thiamine biosynthesis protein ThiS